MLFLANTSILQNKNSTDFVLPLTLLFQKNISATKLGKIKQIRAFQYTAFLPYFSHLTMFNRPLYLKRQKVAALTKNKCFYFDE